MAKSDTRRLIAWSLTSPAVDGRSAPAHRRRSTLRIVSPQIKAAPR